MSFEKPWGNYLLDNIIETPAPESIGFMPQTIAWKVIFVFLIFYVVKKAYQTWKTYQDNRYRREALAWLKQCSLSNETEVRQLPALLRKVALLSNQLMVEANRSGVVQANKLIESDIQNINQLRGDNWLSWLDKQCPKSTFSQTRTISPISTSQLLNTLAYSPHINVDDEKVKNALEALKQQIALWIRYHQLSLPSSANEALETTMEATIELNAPTHNKEGN